jgi:hypothetical protein
MPKIKKDKTPTILVKKEIYDNLNQVQNDAISNNQDFDNDDTIININNSSIQNNNNTNGDSITQPINEIKTKEIEDTNDNKSLSESNDKKIQQDVIKKETRGRKKGVKNKPKIDLDIYNNVNNEVAPTNTTTNTNEVVPSTPTININNYISGTLLLIVIDIVFPTIMKYFFTKLKTLKNKRALNLTSEERKELEPLADEFIKSLSLSLHPAEAFLIVLGFMYASKYASLDETDFIEVKPIKQKTNG